MDSKEVSNAADVFVKERADKTAKTLARFDELPNAAAVDDKVVAILCSCNVSTVWDRVKDGTFVKPIRIGGSTRWNVGELRAFLLTGEAPAHVESPMKPRVGASGKPREKSKSADISLRDYFAAAALPGVLHHGVKTGPAMAYECADEMLRLRDKS